MKYCKNCGFIDEEGKMDACPNCGTPLSAELNDEEAGILSKKAHQGDMREYDKTQNALCFVVLGSISLMVGALFVILSLKKRVNKIVGVNFASLQFVICVICSSLGIGLLAYGLVVFFRAKKKRKQYRRFISVINEERAKLKQ
jgi:uncharacterized membrane protein YvbJ